MKRTFLFDFDGTLVDSMPSFASVMMRILDEYKIEYGNDIIKIITPLGYHGTAEHFRKLGINETVEDLVKKSMLTKSLPRTALPIRSRSLRLADAALTC